MDSNTKWTLLETKNHEKSLRDKSACTWNQSYDPFMICRFKIGTQISTSKQFMLMTKTYSIIYGTLLFVAKRLGVYSIAYRDCINN